MLLSHDRGDLALSNIGRQLSYDSVFLREDRSLLLHGSILQSKQTEKSRVLR
jgi:hypothetical protein